MIHTALLAEARPIIRYFGLHQSETKPFKLFRSAQILLIVSGVGKESTQKAVKWVTDRFQLSSAINIGMAGCNDADMKIGTFFSVQGGPDTALRLPLHTSSIPLKINECEFSESILVDMEASHFISSLIHVLDTSNIHVLKVLSDHLSDTIPDRAFIDGLIENTLPQWTSLVDPYPEKISKVFSEPPSQNLLPDDKEAIRNAALTFRFSYQEIKNLVTMALDFVSWDEKPISQRFKRQFQSRENAWNAIRSVWEKSVNQIKTYKGFTGKSSRINIGAKEFIEIDRPGPGFGLCPVASQKTRCCNLRTLDAIEGCGFDCSYCSIRYFYNSEKVGFNRDFLDKLKAIELNPEKVYHIGTGQSSDSLMWGNRAGILDGLLDFAGENPNVILEFKTKSDNIPHLLHRKVPANVITTWSLNPQIIIDNEEHFTASLERRIQSARKLTAQGNLVGFHFHPMVFYDGWETDYGEIIKSLLSQFDPADVVMISLGTLTFIKPVLKKMREHPMRSRILQMPLEETGGKFSYPHVIKRKMFRHTYECFTPWHEKVFFYLCMEHPSLWSNVFGYDYDSNEEFETAMINSYMKKILSVRKPVPPLQSIPEGE